MADGLPPLQSAAVCGEAHCLAVSVCGRAYSWATARSGNRFGQLGLGDSSCSEQARAVAMPANVRVVQAAAGDNHSALLDSQGGVWLFGCDRWTQLGQNLLWKKGAVWQRTPVHVGGALSRAGSQYSEPSESGAQTSAQSGAQTGTQLIQVACGADHSLAVASDGNVWAWGRGEHGQLFGSSDRPFTAAPRRSGALEGEHGADAVAAAGNCSCARSRGDARAIRCVGQCDRHRRALHAALVNHNIDN